MAVELGPRRATYVNVTEVLERGDKPLSADELEHLEVFDLIYRSLCAVLFNYVPTSGHPGGSISSGRFVAALMFHSLDYDLGAPDRDDADVISYAAGHKALGLYALWALRNEVARSVAPELLPRDLRYQLRLEDLLGFRRNPVTWTPLFEKFAAKALDGHPTPATPFVRLSTGASGVGVASSIGLALAARDYYGPDAPRVHVVEGEGGLTPGRVAESLAAAATACVDNVVLHVDWNQASIDSDQVCRVGTRPGDYVQWDPVELALFHDWNVVYVPDGKNLQQIAAAQRAAAAIRNTQPTAIVYCTVKGWQYGIEGRQSHGAGHGLCSEGFYQAVAPLLGRYDESLPTCCDVAEKRCTSGEDGPRVLEECFWEALEVVRAAVEREDRVAESLAARLAEAKRRLDERRRSPRRSAPRIEKVYEAAAVGAERRPDTLPLAPGTLTTLREELGRSLDYLNRQGQGALLAAAADLLASTSVDVAASAFPAGYFNASDNPGSRRLAVGGICEDAMAGLLSGLSSSGHHIGVGASYGAFIAPLGHVAARLHAIGNQARRGVDGQPYRPLILVCAHAGLKTGEDGPTHADPQALQLLQGNFPAGTAITLTPWEPSEVWPLLATALTKRPAVIAPFVTRPQEVVPDRERLGLAPAVAAQTGVYRLRAAGGTPDGAVVLQGSGVTLAFVEQVLPRLGENGIDLDVYYVASAALFELLPQEQRERIYPESVSREAMGITGFTLPTLDRWILSERGRAMSLHPFMKGHYLGSGQARQVLEEAGLDPESQYEAVLRYVKQPVRS